MATRRLGGGWAGSRAACQPIMRTRWWTSCWTGAARPSPARRHPAGRHPSPAVPAARAGHPAQRPYLGGHCRGRRPGAVRGRLPDPPGDARRQLAGPGGRPRAGPLPALRRADRGHARGRRGAAPGPVARRPAGAAGRGPRGRAGKVRRAAAGRRGPGGRAADRVPRDRAAGASIFLREVQAVWPRVSPYADDRVREGARAAGLPPDEAALAGSAGSGPRLARLAAALVRVSRRRQAAAEVTAEAGPNTSRPGRASPAAATSRTRPAERDQQNATSRNATGRHRRWKEHS